MTTEIPLEQRLAGELMQKLTEICRSHDIPPEKILPELIAANLAFLFHRMVIYAGDMEEVNRVSTDLLDKVINDAWKRTRIMLDKQRASMN